MTSIIVYPFITWMLFRSAQCGEFTVVGDVVEQDIFSCGKKIVLMCSTQSNSLSSMDFKVDGTYVATCDVTTCHIYNNYTTSVSFNMTIGTFNFTLDPVKSSDNGRVFVCNINGQDFTKIPKVAEFSTSLIITSHNVSNGIKVQALTGCMFPSENITFEWFIVKVNASSMEKFYPSNTNTTENNTMCVASLNCNDTGLSSSFIIDIHTPPVRESVYFQVRVSHQYALDKLFSEKRTQQYFDFSEENLNDVISDSTGCFSETWCTVVVAIAIPAGIILFVVIIIFVILRKRKNVDDCPDSPLGLRLTCKTETLATFTWTPGHNPEGQNTFRLCYRKLDDKTSTFKEIKVNGTRKTIKDLHPGCMYQCYVYAMTGNRKSDNSKRIEFTTLGLPDSPTKFEIIKVTETSFLLHWTPGCYRTYDQIFVLECEDTNTGKQSVIKIKEETAASIPFEHRLESLFAGTEYQLMLYAENQIGRSARIGPITKKTLGLPDEPKHLQALTDSVTETTVTLTWKPGKYRTYRQTFQILYRRKDQKNLRWVDVFLKDELKPTMIYKVDSLKEGTTYEFKIYAKNDIGKSKSSNIISVETKGKPESPSELREVESERTSQTITVSCIPGTYHRDTQKFVVNYRRAFKDGRRMTWKHQELVDDGSSSPIIVTIGGLRAAKYYEIAINASNHIGSSAMSETITVKTEELLPRPPTEFVCCRIMETEVQLSWKPVIYKQKQSFYLTYSNEKGQWSEVIPFVNNQEKVEHGVSDLSPGTVYEFSIGAFFGKLEDKKLSERCEVQMITTKGLPDDPVNFHLVDGRLTKTTAEFCWKPGKYRKYKQIFVITYWLKDDEENKTNVTIDDSSENTISHSVNGLQAGKAYYFCIVAKNEIGNSNISDTLHVKTKDEFTDTKSYSPYAAVQRSTTS